MADNGSPGSRGDTQLNVFNIGPEDFAGCPAFPFGVPITEGNFVVHDGSS